MRPIAASPVTLMKSYALYSKLIGASVNGSISLVKLNFKLSNSAFCMSSDEITD